MKLTIKRADLIQRIETKLKSAQQDFTKTEDERLKEQSTQAIAHLEHKIKNNKAEIASDEATIKLIQAGKTPKGTDGDRYYNRRASWPSRKTFDSTPFTAAIDTLKLAQDETVVVDTDKSGIMADIIRTVLGA